MRPLGSGPASRTEVLVERLKRVASSLGLKSPSLSYPSRMVASSASPSQVEKLAAKQKFDYFIVLDLEGQHEIIEFPAIVFCTKTCKEVRLFVRSNDII